MNIKSKLLKTFATIILLVSFFGAQSTLCAKEKMQMCEMKDGKVMTMKGEPVTGCMMKDGKMMMLENGELKPMKKNMTMADGTKCMADGTCIMKSGSKMQLKEGQGLGPAGIFQVKGLTLGK